MTRGKRQEREDINPTAAFQRPQQESLEACLELLDRIHIQIVSESLLVQKNINF